MSMESKEEIGGEGEWREVPGGSELYRRGELQKRKWKDGTEEYYKKGKLDSIKRPDKRIEYFHPDGTMRQRHHPDGTVEYFHWNGGVSLIKLPDGTYKSFNEQGQEILEDIENTGEEKLGPIKTGQHTTPEGVEEFYDPNGNLELRILTDGTTEQYKDGKMIKKTGKDGSELPIDESVMRGKEAEGKEQKTYSTEFIKQRIRSLLESIEEIKIIKNLDVVGKDNQIKIATEIVARKLLTIEVQMEAILESEAGTIKVKSHKIDASAFKEKTESMIVPKLDQVSELLKSYIEKEEKKKVEKMEIVNGELVVTLSSIKKEETSSASQENSVQSDDKSERAKLKERPGFFKRNALRLTLAAGIGLGGYGVGKYVDGKKDDDLKDKISNKESEKKEEARKLEEERLAKEKAEIDRRLEEFRKKQEEMDRKLEEGRKNLDTMKAQAEEKVRSELKQKYAAKAKEKKPLTHSEIIEEIRKKLSQGKKLTADEAMLWNRELMRKPITIGGTGGGEPLKSKIPQKPRIPESGEGWVRTSTGQGGGNIVFNTNPRGIGFNNQPPAEMEKASANNLFRLTSEMLEKIDMIYEHNLTKIFPKNADSIWGNVKDTSAYDLMNKDIGQVEEEYKLLRAYLDELKKSTGLTPRIRDKETVGKFIERCLQYAASQDSKNKKSELLDNLTLK